MVEALKHRGGVAALDTSEGRTDAEAKGGVHWTWALGHAPREVASRRCRRIVAPRLAARRLAAINAAAISAAAINVAAISAAAISAAAISAAATSACILAPRHLLACCRRVTALRRKPHLHVWSGCARGLAARLGLSLERVKGRAEELVRVVLWANVWAVGEATVREGDGKGKAMVREGDGKGRRW